MVSKYHLVLTGRVLGPDASCQFKPDPLPFGVLHAVGLQAALKNCDRLSIVTARGHISEELPERSKWRCRFPPNGVPAGGTQEWGDFSFR